MYKSFWIAEFESGKRIASDTSVKDVYFGPDGAVKPISSWAVIETAALTDCQKKLEEALILLEAARLNLINFGRAKHTVAEIDTFLLQIKNDKELGGEEWKT